MALKDWKKVKYGWRGKLEKIVFNEYFSNPKYEIGIRNNFSSSFHTSKFFKTKPQALKFAKAYRRKN